MVRKTVIITNEQILTNLDPLEVTNTTPAKKYLLLFLKNYLFAQHNNKISIQNIHM